MSRIAQYIAEDKLYIIAEIGQNHQGSLAIAKQLVDSLKGLDVAAIKTAKRDIEVCLTDEQKEMIYDNPNSFGKTYYEHRKALELSKDEFIALKKFVEDAGFDFISSYIDQPSLEFLLDIGVKYLKIASQRTADIALMQATKQVHVPLIISTGMSTISDVDKIVDFFGTHEKYLLQCTSTYPCPEADLNLNVIQTYADRFAGKIDGLGFSGHHIGIAADIGAYILGARIIERHYTLARSMKGTDHAGSLEKRGMELIIKYINQVRLALGSGEKKVLPSEMTAIKKLRADLA